MEVLWDLKEGRAFIFCHRAGALETEYGEGGRGHIS